MLPKFLAFALTLLLTAPAPSAADNLAAQLGSADSDVLSAVERRMSESMLRNDVRARQAVANRRDAAAWAGNTSLEDWRRFATPRIDALRRSLGTLRPRARNLDARVTRVLDGPGYRIENLVYKSRDDTVVTANLYLPAPARAKTPGIILVHSHHNPKTQGELQDMGMTWARDGCAVLDMDQMGYGERRQHPAGPRQDYRFRYIHGIKLQLVGESLMGWMVSDVMRGIDALWSRPDIDREKIILIGSVAGGGDVAAVTAALDDRIACVIPFNFGGPEPETPYPLPDDAEKTFNYMGDGSWESTRCLRLSGRDGFFPWVIVASVAPRRLVYAHEFSWDRARDPVWKRLEKLFALQGASDRLSFTYGYGLLAGKPPEASHCNNVGAAHRRMIHAALERWFGIPVPQEYEGRRNEDELRGLTPEALEKLQPRPLDQAIAALGAARATSTQRALAGLKPGERLERLRRAWRSLLGDIEPAAAPIVKSRTARDLAQGVKLERILLEVEPGIVVPTLLLLPARAKAPVVVGLCQDGKGKFLGERAGAIAQLLERRVAVCLPDLRGTGETRPEGTRQYQSEATAISATEWMLGQTLLGSRLRDLRSVLRYLAERSDINGSRVALWGESFAPTNPAGFADPLIGEGAAAQQSEPLGGLLALFGALYDDGVRAVAARGLLAGYLSVLSDRFCYVPHDAVVPDALTAGDLPDVAAALEPRPLRLEALVDGRNCPIALADARGLFQPTLRAYRSSKDRFLLAASAGNDIASWLADSLSLPRRSSLEYLHFLPGAKGRKSVGPPVRRG